MTFLKFFNLLESQCYQFDFELSAVRGSGDGLPQEKIYSFTSAFKEMQQLKNDIKNIENTISLVHDAIALNIAKTLDDEETYKRFMSLDSFTWQKILTEK